MAEARILSMMRKLECRLARSNCLNICMRLTCFPDDSIGVRKWIDEEQTEMINELRMIVDIMRDNKLEEGRRLDYLVCDVAEMVQVALVCEYHFQVRQTLTWIREIKKHLLKLGVETDSGNVGEDEDEDVVGLVDAVEKLLRTRILNEEISRSTLLLKGMSGIGKTLLARQLYNHSDVVARFDRRAWVCVTHLTIKEILMKLIQQVVKSEELERRDSLLEKMERADNRSLQEMLHRYLQGMRYLIVLDDLPKRMYLRSILEALPREGEGRESRLVITSHTTNLNPIDNYEVYDMEFLDSNKSWQLFLQTINSGNTLKSEFKFPKELEKKGKEMLTKYCCGLPLAIKEVGKQLAKKRCLGSEWEELLQQPFDLGTTLEKLDPFYHKLDEEVKPLFLQMAFYKENTTMRQKKLEQIWVAGGSANVAQYYLKELVHDSFIECKDKETRYHMNAILHMLSIKKAEEEIGFEILRSNGNNRPSQSPRLHRVIICSRDKFNYSTDQDKHLVSLFFHGGGYFDSGPSYWKSFELLKILDWEDFGLKNLPESIGTLIKLRYLGLRNNHIQELPDWLGRLKELEVLDIAQNFMMEVPDIIWEMDSLVHLYMSDVICRKPLKIDALQYLKTLTYVSVDNWTYELSGLKKLRFLEKLGIEELDGNSDVSKLFVSLADLEYLKHLILRGYRFRSMPCLDELAILHILKTLKIDGLLARLPRSFPPNIESLTLANSCLDEDPMSQLAGKLPELKYLRLQNAYTGKHMVILYDCFPNLEVVCLEELWNLRKVERDLWFGRLEIKNCPNLETLPESIKYLQELKMVTTKIIATKIRMSGLISKMTEVDINP
ncbi:putative disease resistance protein At1g58400 isoform X2 [Salvia miltiorrhiza]|uniref:putative disease resistance protein At1g58400 isoform X2 n=1 Tax=Salvia miltiorrhiza TaxID=226208 RepID=UPI0025ABB273|nr:putative disease resistance protein At1g58400 isoform X2 [Salvia miltiorrhiza]